MLENNLYKLNLYELLYTKPTCDYIMHTADSKDILNVLFVGTAPKAIETFKTLFWCSQYPDCNVRVTIAGPKIEIEQVQKEFSDSIKYPALEEYMKKGYITSLQYCELDYNVYCFGFKKNVDRIKIGAAIDSLDIPQNKYTYVILATENPFIDWALLSGLESNYEKIQDKIKKAIICVYNKGLIKNLEKIDKSKLASNVFIEQFEKDEFTCMNADLHRVARNVNLSYCLKGNQRLSVEETNDQFEETCKMEFATEKSERYDADSSYASAVHIPYKLSFCKKYSRKDESSEDGLKILAEAIKEQNRLFNKLIALEHRRWNAYMIMQGYCYPKREEQELFLFSDPKHPHIDKQKKFHMCICDCQEDGLNMQMKEASFWKKKPKKISQLDMVSWFMHNEAEKRAENIEKNFWNQFDFLAGISFVQLKEAIESLFKENANAIDNYRRVYQQVYDSLTNEDASELKQYLELMHNQLQIIIYRNQKVDYFENDAQLINLLPFCMWYGNQYDTVLVFSEGIAVKDIVIPTLLLAKIAIFVGEKGSITAEYKQSVIEFFNGRGNNTTPVFEVCDIDAQISSLAKRYSARKPVITGNEKSIALFRDASDKENIILKYDSKDQRIIGGMKLFYGLEKQSISVREFMRLNGGDIMNVSESPFSGKVYEATKELFWENAKLISNKLAWNCYLNLLLKGRGKSEAGKVSIGIPDKSIIRVFKDKFHKKIYDENDLRVLLTHLEELHLISKLSNIVKDQIVNVEFLTYHKEICDVLRRYSVHGIGEKPQNLDTRLEFYTWPAKSYTRDGFWNESVIYSADGLTDKEKQIAGLTEFYKKISSIGLCSDIRYDNGKIKSLKIRDKKIGDLFAKHGNMFEEIVCKTLQSSYLFDDVQSGVELLWDEKSEERDKNQRLKNKLDLACKDEVLELCDMETYKRIRSEVKKELDCERKVAATRLQHDNELDVIATRGMQAYFISCKNIAPGNVTIEMLKEISGESNLVGAKSILALVLPLAEYNIDNILDQEKKLPAWEEKLLRQQLSEMAFLGKHELSNPERFKAVMETIINDQYNSGYFR